MAQTELTNDLVSHSPFDPKHLPADLMAGLVTFVVALPLCLGIALASGASAIAGVIAGIVAGVVVGWLSGAQVMVSGPAAGLVGVVASQIAALGSFEALLLAVVLAGLIQIALGLAQGGFIKSFVPTSVVRGLLSAIGVILILKQIPHLFGRDTDYEGEMSFFQPDRENTFSELLEIVGALHPGAMAIGLASLALIWIWGRWSVTRASGIPAPLAVVAFGIAAVAGFAPLGKPWMIEPSHRVQLPVAESLGGVLGFLHTPDFAQVGNPAVSWAALTIALSLFVILTFALAVTTYLFFSKRQEADQAQQAATASASGMLRIEKASARSPLPDVTFAAARTRPACWPPRCRACRRR
jgi:carbonic anhydrase/SulP family sulfate permease